MIEVCRISSIEWKPSPVVALATSPDSSQVAAAREDGSLEIWLVSPGSVGWHCQLIIYGDPNSRVSSLVWCCTGSKGLPSGRLFSSSIDGSISEWDLFSLTQKIVVESIGVSIWQMAMAPYNTQPNDAKPVTYNLGNGFLNGNSAHDDDESSGSETEDNSDSDEFHEQSVAEVPLLAVGCDDGCVRLYSFSESDELLLMKSLPRVSGRILSVTWSPDANRIYAGSSDGILRCWDGKSSHEIYRITVGIGGLGSGPELCVWSLLALRCGTLVTADSTGSVQFWDSRHGSLIQAHSYHEGDVNALAASPDHTRVFSAGSDGQVILYKRSSETVGSSKDASSMMLTNKWKYVSFRRAHSHDVRALTLAVPISWEDTLLEDNGKLSGPKKKRKKTVSSYQKWAHLGVPMLISAGDDTKLFAYSAKDFSRFAHHDICRAPQRLPIQLVPNSMFDQKCLLFVQAPYSIDVFIVTKGGALPTPRSRPFGSSGTTKLVAGTTELVAKSMSRRKIVCSTVSNSGSLFAYSDHCKPFLFELRRHESGKISFGSSKKKLPGKLPFAHSMIFSSDSSQLIIAGHDRKIYVMDVGMAKLVHIFTPQCDEEDEDSSPRERPITKMFTSCDGQWLAGVNCSGDVYIFNLENQRQHWFISRLDGASVTAGGFCPRNSNVLVIATSSNQVYALDVDAKQLGEWSQRHSSRIPKRFQEFPGEVVGISFSPSSESCVIIYSSSAMCWIDFAMPVDRDDDIKLVKGKLKRQRKDDRTDVELRNCLKNFELETFAHPVLFIGHLSRNSILIIEKPWKDVEKTFDAAPVHRDIYGT